MTSEHSESELRISNWTLATGTGPGARHVYAANSLPGARRSAPDVKS